VADTLEQTQINQGANQGVDIGDGLILAQP
jgi:hypothetical protein